MKRSTRQGDEPGDVSSDECYILEETVPKPSQKKEKTLILKDDTIANSRKRKGTTVSLPEKKKRVAVESENKNVKLESAVDIKESESSKKKIQSRNVKNRKKEVQSTDKENIQQTLKDTSQILFNSVECNEWSDVDYVSEVNNVEKHIAANVVKLFNDDNTIPFIARYRRNMTNGMEADKLRALKESLDQAKSIKQRASTILKSIDKLGQWSPSIYSAVVSAKSLDDLEHIYSLFKPASKRSLAERAKEIGLGPISDLIIQGQTLPPLSSMIDSNKSGLKTEQEIKDGIIHIVADILNKDKLIFDKVKDLQNESLIKIEATKCKSRSKSSNDKLKDINRKYEMYYDFSTNTRYIKPHQILAINRGEAQKILTVKIVLPHFFEREFKAHCYKQFSNVMNASKLHMKLLNDSIDYCYTKFIKPLVVRRVRSEMKQKAETASIEVFVTNVKQLLLSPPVRGKIILGIDPGFSHGCKLAVISEQGNVLETGVIYPHKKVKDSSDESANVLVHLVNRHKCTILALGNATACRETEVFLNKLMESKTFGSTDVSYTIVDEAGASIYSCSTEAKSEFPDVDTNIISAISIARRIQDPLAELVKVEPKHLGVGMYQHDLPEKQLLTSLNEVVSEVVSFVGVDVNTASQCLLRRVAGLNASRANKIIEWRTEFGPFKNRQQLMDVKGIGNKVFEQCAGFIRILPETSTTDNVVKPKQSTKSTHTFNLLDQTWIHPESYDVAEKFLKYCNCNLEGLGTTAFIENVKSRAIEGCVVLAKKLDTNETTIEVIIKGLSMKKDEDIRLKTRAPLFRKCMLSINDLTVGTSLTGAVRNVTHFGAFVDIGVGRAGLIPTNWLKNCTVSVGQRVEVKVFEVDVERGRIGLELTNVL
ncbi:S1 RNA-binding domain-containing protein 1 [Habropoda laboriosa]|uniref:S1 RNA-binding domain-containing protein 1 n=1 Tax=Habropoda laboriosa TaxID=597456 RepID=A0A0L7QQC8_9HYME|nr:PREDICTED: S1 RNA-binding domain-containing protein 1 [Habropoda laboriosa]KOC60832.1 S1 RNA-binding domain-containing protein 1 [Habropoda laboriosa]